MTQSTIRIPIILFLASIILVSACKKPEPLKFTYKDVPESKLTFERPLEFDFKIDKKNKYDLTLEIVYRQDQLSWDGEHEAGAAPVFIRLTGPTNKEIQDIEHMFTLQDGLGWRGALTQNDNERRLFNPVIKGAELKPGNYTLAVFSNAKHEHAEFPIIGVQRMGLALKGWK